MFESVADSGLSTAKAAAAAAALDARPEGGPMGGYGGRRRSAQIGVFDVLLMVVVLKGV